jgi:hypothetical protein
MSLIPYTHWSYWSDRDAGERCRAELADLGFRVGPMEWSDPLLGEMLETMPWALRAAREVDIDELVERHKYVEAIVERFGGFYDGGEASYLDDGDLTPAWNPDLPPVWDPRLT